MIKNQKTLIEQFKGICSNCYYDKTINTLKPFSEALQYGLDFHDQFQRGIQIENVLVEKVLMMNELKSLHRIDGSIFNGVYKIRGAYTSYEWLALPSVLKNPLNKKFKSKDIHIGSPDLFKARYRCLTQPRIETCCIDLLIDDTIIDIKTDIDTKQLKKYVRQVFLQAVQYMSFLNSTKQYNLKFHDFQIEMIERPINNIGIFFWRRNEFYKFSIRDMLGDEDLDKIVNIYTLLRPTHGAQLRLLAKKHLFLW